MVLDYCISYVWKSGHLVIGQRTGRYKNLWCFLNLETQSNAKTTEPSLNSVTQANWWSFSEVCKLLFHRYCFKSSFWSNTLRSWLFGSWDAKNFLQRHNSNAIRLFAYFMCNVHLAARYSATRKSADQSVHKPLLGVTWYIMFFYDKNKFIHSLDALSIPDEIHLLLCLTLS